MTRRFTTKSVQRMKQLLQRQSTEAPGTGYAALAVADSDGLRFSIAFIRGAEAAAAHRSSIASITKPITATAVMQLVEAGTVQLDEPIATYVPGFDPQPSAGDEHAAPVMVRHVLTHTSGLADLGDMALRASMHSTASMLDALFHQRLRFAPGTAYSYASDSWYLLSAMIERVSGAAYAEFLRTRIFVPTGMASTTFDPRLPGPDALPAEGGFAVENLTSDELVATFAALPMPGGGLWSTPEDIVGFGRVMLLGGSLDGLRILERETLERMTTVQTTSVRDFGSGEPRHYGLGWNRPGLAAASPASPSAFGHTGATGSALIVDPERDLVVVYLGNWWDAPMAAADEAVAAVYEADSL